MATIFNNIDRVAGDPQTAEVRIDLVWDTSSSPVARNTDEDTFYRGPFRIDVDEDGHWSVVIAANDDILPLDNAYKITETLLNEEDDTDEISNVYYIFVPATASPSYWVGDILIDTPDWI